MIEPQSARPRVCICYPFTGKHGMDRICANAIEALLGGGFEVSIAGLYQLNLAKMFKDDFDVSIPENLRVFSLLPSRLAEAPLVSPIWHWFSVRIAIRSIHPDIIYTHGLAYKGLKKQGLDRKVVAYLDEPVELAFHDVGNAYLARVYRRIYSLVTQLVTDEDAVDVILCSSNWSAELFRKRYGRGAQVLFPPVSTRKFVSGRKENLVTCVGVVNPRKKLEDVVTAVAKAKSRPTLRIVGRMSAGYAWYPRYLRWLAKKLNAEKRIHIHLNAPFQDLVGIVSKSKVCVSAGIEFFGIAVVEQMSAGCVPIVKKAYAPWHDIIDKGNYGIGFATVEELTESIDRLLSDDDLYARMARKAVERAKLFDESVYRAKFVNLMRRLAP